MAGSLNKCLLIGNVGKDPEVREVGDSKVANFSLATSESWTKNGEKVEKTFWHNVVVWGKLADVIEKYVTKGSKLYIEGAVETRSYEKDGQTRYTTEIVLRGFDSKMIMLDGKRSGGDAGDGMPDSYEPPVKRAAVTTPVEEDEIIF